MRLPSLLLVLLACAGCHAGARVTVPVRVSVEADVRVEARAEARARAQAETTVELEGAPIVEFFGIPLEGSPEVVFVLDRSGSMNESVHGPAAQIATPAGPAGRKIDVAQEELVAALEKLPEGTRVNVVFFNDQLEAYAPSMVPLEERDRERLVQFVRETTPERNTALAYAMRVAFLMNAGRVVLLSDGLGNVGGDADIILQDAREAMRGGVRIDTIGLGIDQDDDLLRALATESGGIYQRL